MNEADIIVIGAGVVGLAVAAEIAGRSREVYVLEKNDGFGKEQSSRNSEVVHAGIYYDKDSLRHRLCLEGNRLMYALAAKHGIPCHECGKIIVAVNQLEADEMAKLFQRGIENGVPLRLLSRKEMKALEPALEGMAAFYSPTTGIVDSYALMRYLAAKARSRGAQLVFRAEVTGLARSGDGWRVEVRDAAGSATLTSSLVINCAGLYSDRIAALAGIDIDKAGYRLHPVKGEYYSVAGELHNRVRRLVYPVPTTISVGAHVCFDTDWRLRLGPIFRYTTEFDYRNLGEQRQALLGSSIMKALPFIGPEDIAPEGCGIMAMLQAAGEGFRDFIIRHEADRGLPGLIDLVGIESPGLTSSPAIGRYVARLVDEIIT